MAETADVSGVANQYGIDPAELQTTLNSLDNTKSGEIPTPEQAANDVSIPHEGIKLAEQYGISSDDLKRSLAAVDEAGNQAQLQDKYGSVSQQLKAGAEGLAEGIAGPLAPLAETSLGIAKDEDIRARAKVNPITHGGFTVLGLAGSALTGVGLGAGLLKVGAGATKGAQLLGIGKIGSAVVTGAIENAAFQASDELTKMVLKDPDQSAEHAVASMGLASLLGGGIGGIGAGVISPLWKATMSSKTGGLLTAAAQKLGGIEGISGPVDEMIARSGIEVPPDVKARLSDSPTMQAWSKTLEQSDLSASAHKHQESLTKFRQQGGDIIAQVLGKTPKEVETLGAEGISKYETGKKIGNTFADEYGEKLAPISKGFDDLKTKFKNVDLDSSVNKSIDEKIAKLAIDEGWTASPSSDIMRETNRVLKELPLQKNVKNLGDFITQVGNNTSKDPLNGSMLRAGSMIKGILKDAESDVIASKLGSEAGPQAVEAFQAARTQYRAQSQLKEAIDASLHAGGSTSGYSKAVKKMAQMDGETVLNRLSGKGDAALLKTIEENFPKTANLIRQYHIDEALKIGADKAKTGMTLNSEAVLKKLDGMSPELRQFVMKGKDGEQIQAVGDILQKLNEVHHNYSNTARTWADRMIDMPGTALGLVTGLISHSPVVGVLTKPLFKLLSVDAPDAMKLGLMKWLGSSKPISPTGLKAAVDAISHTAKGADTLNKASKNVFQAGKEVLPARMLPSARGTLGLDKALQTAQNNPDKLLNTGGETGYYMPEHAGSMARIAAGASQYLNSQRPSTQQPSPLDTPMQPSPAQKNAYNRLLELAQQPIHILNHVKEGTVQTKDVEAVKTMYPSLYNNMVTKIGQEMVNAKAKGIQIPYKTKLGLSVFTGQPMDSTMTPHSIQTIMQAGGQQAPQQHGQQPSSNGRPSSPALNKISKPYQTPGQAAESRRATRD